MMNTLSNKLFLFETVKKEKHNATFLFLFATDIIKLLKKVKEEGLEYNLTQHEREVAKDVRAYYNEHLNTLFEIAS